MSEHQTVPDTIFSNRPLRKVVHFDNIISISTSSTRSISLLTSPSSTSLSLPLIAEKAGVRFKLLILLFSLFIALIIGFILSLIFVTQFISLPRNTTFSLLTEKTFLKKNSFFFEHELDFHVNICENFYDFVCRKWLINHPLSSLDFKRSWLTERSKDIRENFAQILTNLTEIYVYNYQLEIEKNQTDDISIDDYNEIISSKNELEQFYSFNDIYDNEQHQLSKRQLNSNENLLSRSITNMFRYYHQCLHTSKFVLIEELQQLAHDRFWFTNKYDIISTINHFDLFFEQMIEHPLMKIWNINTINLDTQIIIHIQKQIQNPENFLFFHQIEQANLFEHYLQINHIDLCYQSLRVGSLTNTLKQYNELLISSLIYSNSSIYDDLKILITNQSTLPIIYSSIKYSNDLKDFIQFMLNENLIQSLNNTDIYHLFLNFTYDLEQNLIHIPIFRSTISYQCQLYLNYYIRFRSLNQPKIETWIDYISSSIIHLIVHSWPGDASYICLYTTIVRHQQFEIISYWNRFLYYTKKQIKDNSSPIITVEIRLVDFFQLDSIFRFLFADQYAHYCNLMIYKYGPKLLSFISVFHQDIQINLKNLWKQILQDNSNKQINIHSLPFPSNRISTDCLTLLEYYYPFTLSSFYEEYMFNKTKKLYSIAYELRDILSNNSNNQFLSSIQFHIKPERLKLYYDLSSTTTTTTKEVHIPYEYYLIEDNYFSTSWNIIESSSEEFLQPIHEFFEINAYHTIEQGIFLQPTLAELYSNKTTSLAVILIIAHELGHALCPCGMNLTEREYFADLIALYLINDYYEKQLNKTNFDENMKKFFIYYGQTECTHINHEMLLLMNKKENFNEYHVNYVLKNNELFQRIFHCPKEQQKYSKKLRNLLPELCTACRKKNILRK